jgi:hypothetical protein
MIPKDGKSQESHPAFREQIQNHPLMVVIGACIAVAASIVVVIQYFHNQVIKQITTIYEQEITELRRSIGSIERRRGDQKYRRLFRATS